MNILVRRTMALGDCLCVTPILTRLRKENPDAFISVATGYYPVFEGNPYIDGINVEREWDWIYELDMVHENNRSIHAIEAYMVSVFGDRGEHDTDKSIVFTPCLPPRLPLDWKRVVTLHPNHSWENRRMPNEWWDHVATGLGKAGYRCLVVGTQIDYCPPNNNVVDCRNQLNLHQQAAVIGASRLFICGASGLFILAACTDVPVIVPLTINRPHSALPWRHGKQGFGYYPILADVDCIGCSERAGPVTSLGCERGDFACIPTIKAEHAVELALGILDGKAADTRHGG